MKSDHLIKQRQGWYVRLVVPEYLRSVVGRRELVRTLRTRDLAEANRRKHAVLAELQRVLSSATGQREVPQGDPNEILQIAKAQRQLVTDGVLTENQAEQGFDIAEDQYLDNLRAKFGTDPETGEPKAPDEYSAAFQLGRPVFEGAALMSEQMETYLQEAAAGVRQQTLLDKRRAFNDFKDWLKRDVEVRAITKQVAGRYVGEKLAPKGWAPKTIKTTLSHLSSFWTWLEGRGLVDGNPWRRMAGTLAISKRGREASRRGWADDELQDLLKKLPVNDPLFSMTAIAIYTGMRREEVCQLKVTDVVNGALKIREGKSAAAIRDVPIHPVLKPMIESLAAHTSDGYLLPGLLTGGPDKKRGHLEGKRFSYFIRNNGFTDPALDFHALRYSFTDRCRAAGIPESTADLLTGHERPGKLSYGSGASGYSQGLPIDILAKEMQKVTYGEPVDHLVRTAGPGVRVESKSRRRPRARRDVLTA